MKAFGLHQCLKIRRILSEINKTFSIIYILYGTLLDFVGLFKACKIGARMLIGNRKESRSWKNVWILFKNKINKEEFIQFKNSFIKIGTVSASKLFSKVNCQVVYCPSRSSTVGACQVTRIWKSEVQAQCQVFKSAGFRAPKLYSEIFMIIYSVRIKFLRTLVWLQQSKNRPSPRIVELL